MSKIYIKLLNAVRDLLIELTRSSLKLKFFKTDKIKYYENAVGIDFVLTPIPEDEESFNKAIEQLKSLGFTIAEDYESNKNRVLFDFQGIVKVLALKSIKEFDLVQDSHKKLEEVLAKDYILNSLVLEMVTTDPLESLRIYKILTKIVMGKKSHEQDKS